ncbi:MAG: ion channel [Pseudomonadota bacterium]
MLQQIALGSLLLVVSVVLTSLCLVWGHRWLPRLGDTHNNSVFRQVSTIALATLWIVAALSATVWLWALTFCLIGEFTQFEAALYFAGVAATTLGFGDQLLSPEWRLLSGFIAANGLLLFGLAGAYLLELMQQVFGARPHGHPGADFSQD